MTRSTLSDVVTVEQSHRVSSPILTHTSTVGFDVNVTENTRRISLFEAWLPLSGFTIGLGGYKGEPRCKQWVCHFKAERVKLKVLPFVGVLMFCFVQFSPMPSRNPS